METIKMELRPSDENNSSLNIVYPLEKDVNRDSETLRVTAGESFDERSCKVISETKESPGHNVSPMDDNGHIYSVALIYAEKNAGRANCPMSTWLRCRC